MKYRQSDSFIVPRMIIDNKTYNATEEGTAQDNIISPILANIYMHNVLVPWYRFIIKENFKGANFLVVYADDFIAGFELESEAKQYYELLKERMNRLFLKGKQTLKNELGRAQV